MDVNVKPTLHKPKPPVAKRVAHSVRRHNHVDEDPYVWLRDPDWQAVMRDPQKLSRDIRDYLDAENTYLDVVMAPTQTLQDQLYTEMKGRIKEDDSSVPAPDGPFEYYHRYRTGGQHPLICRRPRGRLDFADEEILVDGDKEAEGHAYFVLADADHSLDHRLVAIATDVSGAEFCTVHVREIVTGREFPDLIEDVAGGVVWAPGSRGFYYVRLDDNHRARRAYYHALGRSQADDILLYEETDPGFFVGVSLSEQEEYLLIDVHDHQTSEVWFARADDPGAKLTLIAPRRTEVEYEVAQFGKSFLILTNEGGAEDFELRVAPIASPGPENWRPLIPHRKGRLLLDVDVTARHLAWMERERALPRISIAPMTEIAAGVVRLGEAHAIEFAEQAYSLGMSSGYEFDTDNLRFSYGSPTTPSQTYDYDMGKRARTLRKTQEVPSGHDPADYVTRRIFARATDGAEVPITILHRADTVFDGSNPLLLYGYGAYGISLPASFSTVRLSLVDRGFVYAIAHVRGGMENGYHWYAQGKRQEKMNTFTDYIACAERLIHEGLTREGRIVGQGGSAGGLLMGAVANMAPELFLGLIAEVPFVDVLNTISDASLPLSPPEWGEWGNPIENAEACAYIRSYAPYDNVGGRAYPHILATAGLTDPRVTYWEPAKWVAKLRALKTDAHHLLFKTHMEAGHGGASGRFDSLKDDALAYAFALMIASDSAKRR
jgi:oligopeptidase B